MHRWCSPNARRAAAVYPSPGWGTPPVARRVLLATFSARYRPPPAPFPHTADGQADARRPFTLLPAMHGLTFGTQSPPAFRGHSFRCARRLFEQRRRRHRFFLCSDAPPLATISTPHSVTKKRAPPPLKGISTRPPRAG